MLRQLFSYEALQLLIYTGVLAGVCFVAGTVINFIVYFILSNYNRRRKSVFITLFIRHTKNAIHLFTPFLLILLTSPLLKAYSQYPVINKAAIVLFYISFAWLVIKMIYVFTDALLAKHNYNVKDNLTQRRLYTQIQFLKRIGVIVVIVLFVSIILLNFEGIRKIGAGILTSAGVAGIIIGFAAQRSLSNLLAGLQIAFSQPIKIDDAVIVENEFGNVEEITLTYVIIKIWDLRRLVVPLNYFIEKPFQNWTRTSAEILGTVSLFVDYKMPVEPLRKELTRLLDSNPLWDRKTNVMQVINANDRTVEVRALMGALNGGDAWNLRCFVREKLLEFIQVNYPDCLPKVRNEVVMRGER
ncbi:MAG TPA: mechanosensitive ion channel domain-containing protein [Bacteroidales bacterium]|nr:mechanosensitive ion channel domain-containing protein [Bacteroidales bacterium]